MWRIYYGDGSEFSSDDGDVFDAPRSDVQLIAYLNPNTGKTDLISQSDVYYYEPEKIEWGWWYCSREGMVLHLLRAKRPLVFFGGMIRTKQFDEIEKKAIAHAASRKGSWRRFPDEADTGTVQ